MKKLIIILFLLLFLPIGYYFCYALPQHNKELQQIERDKLEYLKEQDSKREYLYDNCIDTANKWRSDNFNEYCELSYKMCVDNVKAYWNWFVPNQQSYSVCEKYKMDKDGNCYLLDNYAKDWKEWYEKQLEICNRYL